MSEVKPALKKRDDNARRVAGTHAAAFNDKSDVGYVDIEHFHGEGLYARPPTTARESEAHGGSKRGMRM